MEKKVSLLDKNAEERKKLGPLASLEVGGLQKSVPTGLKRTSTTDLNGNDKKRFAYLVNFSCSISFRRIVYAEKLNRVFAGKSQKLCFSLNVFLGSNQAKSRTERSETVVHQWLAREIGVACTQKFCTLGEVVSMRDARFKCWEFYATISKSRLYL